MDPNATLLAYLEARAEAGEAAVTGEQELAAQFMDEALGHADNLFTWLSNGGFEPDWAHARLMLDAR
jgi:hypothetical protein